MTGPWPYWDSENVAALCGLNDGQVEPLIALLRETDRRLHPEIVAWIKAAWAGSGVDWQFIKSRRTVHFSPTRLDRPSDRLRLAAMLENRTVTLRGVPRGRGRPALDWADLVAHGLRNYGLIQSGEKVENVIRMMRGPAIGRETAYRVHGVFARSSG